MASQRGIRTLESYSVTHPNKIPIAHVDWLRRLPKTHDDGLRFFVHAGVHPDRPLDQQNDDDMLWTRGPFLSSNKDFGRLIVHGHTPTEDGKPEVRINRLNIDTGAVFGGPLTAAVFEDSAVEAARFLTF